tara:strand:+ start:1834 stop:2112 length:279 start_codon:yes stop_codon:yes gene_type:complete
MPFKGKRMNVFVKGYLEEMMTCEPKTLNTILDDLYIYLSKRHHPNRANGFKRIPTRGELIQHLNANYSKVKLSIITGKPVKNNGLMHYFKEE